MTTNTYIGTGFSTHNNPLEAAKIACLQAQKKIRQKKPNLVFVFTTVHFQGVKLLEGIYHVFGPNINVLGCSGFGIITDSGIYKYGVAVMAIYSTKIKFGIGSVPEVNKISPRASGEKFAHTALKQLGTSAKEIAIIFSNGLIEKGSELLFSR